MAAPTKKYGLITLPKKNKQAAPLKKASIFDSDDSDEDHMAAANREIVLSSQKNKTKRQTQLEIDKALADDPNVYEYDELYDDMKNKEKQLVEEKLNTSKNVERKSKYITGLLKAAEKRTKEHERRAEKQVQKEREAEGDEFADKEQFVTSAYKKKMAEMEKLEEEEKRKEALEDAMDVTKQSDMTGFYRNLYKQTLGTGPDGGAHVKQVKQEAETGSSDKQTDDTAATPAATPAVTPAASVKTEQENDNISDRDFKDGSSHKNSKRHYRRRDTDSSSPPPSKISDRRPRSRSRSRDKRQRSRSRSRDRKQRDRSRNRDRHRHGDRSKRSHRSKSRERRRRSPSSENRKSNKSKSQKECSKPEERDRSSNSVEAGLLSVKSRSASPSAAEDKTVGNSSTNDTTVEAEKKSRFSKRNDSQSIQSARERYLARKATK